MFNVQVLVTLLLKLCFTIIVHSPYEPENLEKNPDPLISKTWKSRGGPVPQGQQPRQ